MFQASQGFIERPCLKTKQELNNGNNDDDDGDDEDILIETQDERQKREGGKGKERNKGGERVREGRKKGRREEVKEGRKKGGRQGRREAGKAERGGRGCQASSFFLQSLTVLLVTALTSKTALSAGRPNLW